MIVGGESGPGARPFHLEHAREIIRACRARCFACVAGDRDAPCEHRPAVFVKQLGSKPVSVEDRISHRGDTTSRPAGFYRFLNDRKGGDPAEWPADLRVREFPAVAE